MEGSAIATAVNPYLWAKKSEQNGRYMWLPLKQHLVDTVWIADRLWEQWLNDGQRQYIIQSLSQPNEDDAKGLVRFLAATHDIGKAAYSFQVKEGFIPTPDLDAQLLERMEQNGFKDVAVKSTAKNVRPHALAGEAILHWHGVEEDIGSIIGGHHGKPLDYDLDYLDQTSYKENYFQVHDKTDPIYQNWEKVQKEILLWALEISGFEAVENLPNISQPSQVLLSGLLIMADWIASNERFFPLIDIEEIDIPNQKARLESGWMDWFKNYPWSVEYLSDAHTLYTMRFNFDSPREEQAAFTQVIENIEEPGIIIFEAPMGLGKTEAALVAVEQLAKKTGRSGLYFGLPTQATSNGIFPRIKDWLTSIQQESGDSYPIRLAHGKAALNDAFMNVSRNIDIDGDGSVYVNEWFSGRKTSALDEFVVGTVDQFLMVGLKQKHLALRHLGFSKKIIIIDEVHAYDIYSSDYLLKAVQWMGAYGIPIIILSATLPSKRRQDLIEMYIRGKGGKLRKENKTKSMLHTDAYPLITYTEGNEVKQFKDFTPSKTSQVNIVKVNEKQPYSLLGEIVHEEGIIGVIVNTVKRAQELAHYCAERYGEEQVTLLHSNFIATERAKKEQQLLDMIGKDGERPKQKIIIGTQVLEQSLDIDFDVLISDLAPMDLLIQRVGRLHRHEKTKRPKSFKEPTLYVLGTNEDLDFEGGANSIYGGYLLTRTQYFLPEILTLPTDISTLVQKVYGESELELAKELQSIYKKMKDEEEAKSQSKKSKAKAYQINKPARPSKRRKPTLIGWLKSGTNDSTEEKAQARVRDTNETIEVIALKKVSDGYGTFREQEDLSFSITDSNTARKIAAKTLRLPYALSHGGNIDETIEELEAFNQQHLFEWQNSSWLKGALGVIFDEDNQYRLNGYVLTYDEKYGLHYDKEGKNDEI